MDLATLRLLGSGVQAVQTSFGELARVCHGLTENLLDVRFHVLEDCCRILERCFEPDGEDIAVTPAFFEAVNSVLASSLVSVLDAPSELEAVTLAQHLREELALLAAQGPTTFQ